MVFAFNVEQGLLRFELFLISFQQLIYFKPQITQRFYHPFLTIYKKNHYEKRKGKIKFGNGFALLLPLVLVHFYLEAIALFIILSYLP